MSHRKRGRQQRQQKESSPFVALDQALLVDRDAAGATKQLQALFHSEMSTLAYSRLIRHILSTALQHLFSVHSLTRVVQLLAEIISPVPDLTRPDVQTALTEAVQEVASAPQWCRMAAVQVEHDLPASTRYLSSQKAKPRRPARSVEWDESWTLEHFPHMWLDDFARNEMGSEVEQLELRRLLAGMLEALASRENKMALQWLRCLFAEPYKNAAVAGRARAQLAWWCIKRVMVTTASAEQAQEASRLFKAWHSISIRKHSVLLLYHAFTGCLWFHPEEKEASPKRICLAPPPAREVFPDMTTAELRAFWQGPYASPDRGSTILVALSSALSLAIKGPYVAHNRPALKRELLFQHTVWPSLCKDLHPIQEEWRHRVWVKAADSGKSLFLIMPLYTSRPAPWFTFDKKLGSFKEKLSCVRKAACGVMNGTMVDVKVFSQPQVALQLLLIWVARLLCQVANNGLFNVLFEFRKEEQEDVVLVHPINNDCQRKTMPCTEGDAEVSWLEYAIGGGYVDPNRLANLYVGISEALSCNDNLIKRLEDGVRALSLLVDKKGADMTQTFLRILARDFAAPSPPPAESDKEVDFLL